MGPENGKYDGSTDKTCSAVVKDKREIERVTDNLEIEISTLQNTVNTLFSILEPITRPADPTGEDCEKEQGNNTPLGSTIFNYVRCVRNVNDELSDILRRIEL